MHLRDVRLRLDLNAVMSRLVMFLVTIYLYLSLVNNFTPNEPPGETFTT